MKYSIQHIGAILKNARLEKGLSQRALSTRSGVPQSHISKIESGLVNLQTSSLIELARALDLELLLVPRVLVHTVQALQRGMKQKGSQPRPKYHLDEEENEE
ncbi:MAG: helix-turn-helix transcriptional regulator [Verrucomicrobia bacterium]|nr:helix-turn-helix transcriptional regulator [Verrucomicrobiota bacterium]